MDHYTPKFKIAYDQVLKVLGEQGEHEARICFRDLMLELGHDERVRNLYRIQDKLSKKAVFFRLNPPQNQFMLKRAKRNMILKCRQVGFTTLSCIRGLDKALWEANTRAGIMCHKLTLVKTIFNDITKFAYQWFKRDWGHLYRPTQDSDSSSALSFVDDGLGTPLESSILVLHDFRGKTVHFLHVSESARIETDRLSGSVNGVPDNGEIIHESTAFGMDGEFYRLWQAWKDDRASAPCKGFFIPWYEHYPEILEDWEPEPNTEWTSYEQHLLDDYNGVITPNHLIWRRFCIKFKCEDKHERFENEYPTNDQDCFTVNESSVFPHSIIKLQQKTIKPPMFDGFLLMNERTIKLHDDPKGMISIWNKPDPSHSYVCGADPSGGVGRDNAAAYIKDQQTGELVARIWGSIDPAEFARELYKLCSFFNKAWICLEINNHGHLVSHVLKEMGYRNLYKRRVIDELTNKPTRKIGFQTSNENKLMITEKFKNSCRDGKTVIHDLELIKEMTAFIQVSSPNGRTVRRQARSNARDDLVMASSLCDEMDSTREVSESAYTATSPLLEGNLVDPETGFIIGDLNAY